MLGEGVGEEALAGGAGEDGQIELADLVEVGQQWVVFIEALAEAEAGVEDDLVALDAGGHCRFEAHPQFGEDKGEDFVWGEGWERGPVLRAASGVHQDGSAAELCACRGHVRVPEVAADVVDDLCPSFDGVAGGGGVEGVDGEDGCWALLEERFDDGEDAGLFFARGEGGGIGAGGFAANVDDVGGFVEHFFGLFEGPFRGMLGSVEVAAVREGVRCDVEDAHDEGPSTKGEGAGAEVPVVMGARREGHGGILKLVVRCWWLVRGQWPSGC